MKAKMKIRKGDTVEIISGRFNDKGKRGEVIKVLPKEQRVVVQGVNIRKKHQSQMQTQGRTINPGIIEFEGKMHVSNVMVVCPKCDETSRLRLHREDGEVIRICKRCGGEIG